MEGKVLVITCHLTSLKEDCCTVVRKYSLCSLMLKVRGMPAVYAVTEEKLGVLTYATNTENLKSG
jgi:archaellum biogenesis ATPase FlaH